MSFSSSVAGVHHCGSERQRLFSVAWIVGRARHRTYAASFLTMMFGNASGYELHRAATASPAGHRRDSVHALSRHELSTGPGASCPSFSTLVLHAATTFSYPWRYDTRTCLFSTGGIRFLPSRFFSCSFSGASANRISTFSRSICNFSSSSRLIDYAEQRLENHTFSF